METITIHLSLLGVHVEDKVTGFSGVVTMVSFDLWGNIQALIHPGLNKDGELREGIWFHISRLRVTSKERVMNVPYLHLMFPANAPIITNDSKDMVEKPAYSKV